MREAGNGAHGLRLRALIVVLWRAGLRISEALALSERDLDPARGALLVRHGKGGKRREVGMDEWGWNHLSAVARDAPRAAGRCAVLRHLRSHPRPALLELGSACTTSAGCGSVGGSATFRTPSIAPRPCGRDGARGDPAEHRSAPARPRPPRRHLDLPPGHRQRRDHRHGPGSTNARCSPLALGYVRRDQPKSTALGVPLLAQRGSLEGRLGRRSALQGKQRALRSRRLRLTRSHDFCARERGNVPMSFPTSDSL
jgi:hypothetical protein